MSKKAILIVSAIMVILAILILGAGSHFFIFFQYALLTSKSALCMATGKQEWGSYTFNPPEDIPFEKTTINYEDMTATEYLLQTNDPELVDKLDTYSNYLLHFADDSCFYHPQKWFPAPDSSATMQGISYRFIRVDDVSFSMTIRFNRVNQPRERQLLLHFAEPKENPN